MTVQELIDVLNNNVEDKNQTIFLGEMNLKKEEHIKKKYMIKGIGSTFCSIVILYSQNDKFEGLPPVKY